MTARKQIALVVATGDRARVREALRAAVGLALRGDAVRVVLGPEARALANSDEPAVARAYASFGQLGILVVDAASPEALPIAVRNADACEVWT